MKYILQSTQTFNRWLSGLKDRTVKNQLLSRLARVENGHFGDAKALPDNLFELRCFFGGVGCECITQFVTKRWFCCWWVETKPAKGGTSKKPKLFCLLWRIEP